MATNGQQALPKATKQVGDHDQALRGQGWEWTAAGIAPGAAACGQERVTRSGTTA